MKARTSIRMNRQTVSLDKKIDLLLEAGQNVFQLRWRKQVFQPPKMFGIEDFIISPVDDPRNKRRTYNRQTMTNPALVFTPDEDGVAIAYLIDTPRNRVFLALHFYNTEFFEIMSMLTPDGTVPGRDVKTEMLKIVKEMNIEPANPADSAIAIGLEQRRRYIDEQMRKAGKVSPEAPASPPTSPYPTSEPKPLAPATKEDVEAAIVVKQAILVSHLKKKHGAAYKRTKDYKETIGFEVDRVWAEIEKQKEEQEAAGQVPEEIHDDKAAPALVN
jgi:hypothetical protein